MLPPANVAPTVFELFIVSVHVVDVKDEQSPLQPKKSPAVPDAGKAVSVSEVPAVTFALHSFPPAEVQ